jgi:hypothetical protein
VNLDELKLIMQLLKVPDDVASVGRLRDDRFCLLPNEDGTYEVFWYERGGHHDACVYDNLEAGCYGFLGLLGGQLRGPQFVREGQGTQYSVGGAPLDHPAVRALFGPGEADLYGGLGEAAWSERFVVPEDRGAPIGRRRLIWPPQDEHPDGFASATGRQPARLAPGVTVDTFGPTFTHVLYEAGVPFAARSLPVDYAASGYRRWRVLKETAVWSGPVAPWFGQPGGGIQHFALMPVADLVGTGFLEEIDRTGVVRADPAIGELFSEDLATSLYWRTHVTVPEGLVSDGQVREQSWCFLEGKDGWWDVFFYEHGSRSEDLGRADSRQAALRLIGGRLLYTDIINRED